MSRVEEAVNNYKKGYSCSQAVACAYADTMNMSDDTAFRISEGFGRGMGGYGHTCGSCSAMVMVASYHLCTGIETDSKKNTYPAIKAMVQKFKEANGDIDCFSILCNGQKGLEDGKRISCIRCIENACEQLKELTGKE